jgi:hypothetical protein
MAQHLDNSPRSRKTIEDYADGFEIIPARSTAESEPAYFIPTGNATRLLTYCKYSGSVTSAALRIWYYTNGVWYRGTTTDSGAALTGANEAREWEVSRQATVGFTVDSIAGGGTVAVICEAVR